MEQPDLSWFRYDVDPKQNGAETQQCTYPAEVLFLDRLKFRLQALDLTGIRQAGKVYQDTGSF